MPFNKIVPTVLLLGTLAGCRVGPKYARPAVDLPQDYRGLAPEAQANPQADATASLGDQKWAEVFQDPVLRQLIKEALDNNKDLKIAATRILEQQESLGIARAAQKPTVSGSSSYNAIGLPSGLVNGFNSGSNTFKIPQKVYEGSVGLSAAWNLDFWGLYRSQTDAARAQLLATKWAQRLTVDTIIENVATGYFQLRTLDAELAITRQTLKAREESLQLTQTLEHGGQATMADVRQAEELTHTAAAQIPSLEQQIEVTENALSLLLGRNPGPILRNTSPATWPTLREVPAGLPSQLLVRRPDIQQAEASLEAANANIGVARAQLFPQIALSASGSTSSSQLKKIVDSQSMLWMAAGSLAQTIFDGGRLRSNVRLSKAQQQEQIIAYQRTIQQALASVSDALVSVRK